MFGIFRYFLSLLVAFGHIQFFFQGDWNWTGLYSVFGFFLLSGYLMTRVLHQTYGYSARGFTAYLANRALRIYPAYWAALALSLGCLAWAPDFAVHAKSVMYLPTSAAEYLLSVIVVGVDRDFTPRVVPVAWSLHVELCFYALIGLGLSRTRWSTAAWLVSSVGWTTWAVLHGVEFGDRFSTVTAASLPFALGAGLHFVRWSVPRWLLFVGLVLFTVNLFAAPLLWTHAKSPAAFYLSLLLVLLVVAGLRDIRPSGRLALWDRRLGDLSYPIFLVHSQVGYLFAWLKIADNGTFALFLVCLPAIHIVAAGIHFGVVAPLERLRSRVRSRVVPATAGGAPRRRLSPQHAAVLRRAAPAIALTSSLLVGALAGEAVLRLLAAWTPPTPPRELPADTRGLPVIEGAFPLAVPNQRSNYRGALYTTNSRGFRGPEIAIPKPRGIFRIAALGDSYAMGSGVRYEEAYPERAARSLARTPDGRQVEAINLAIAGWPLTRTVEAGLPLALEADSDLMVYGWTVNDLEGPNYRRTLESFRPPGRSLLVNLLRERWEYARDIFWPSPTSYLGELDENYFHNPAAWREFESGLDKLAEAGRSTGACVVVYLLPEMQILSRFHPYTRFHDAVAEAARRRNLYVINGFPAFLDKDPVPLRCGPLDWHPNAEAHAILGEVLVNGLRQLPESCWSPRAPAASIPPS